MAIFGAARGTVEIMKEKAILHKINELFEYRGIRDLASELGQMDNGVYDKLIEIQYRIFLYDKHLEQFEYPLRTELERLWKDIVLAMKDLGCSDEEASELLSEIETYARNELAMRQGVKLNSLPISYFYYYKSCDVRLMRKLLRWKAGASTSSHSDFQWYIFDWVTEVNDDVSDVQEDRNTFNGNRFLHGCLENGYDFTARSYKEFLFSLREKLGKNGSKMDMVHRHVALSISEIERTLELISELEAEFQVTT